ncbi:metallophosphoesterase family protein [Pelotomaculum propionicicum]|uniref:Phosphoesterase n=1 Tax=Pelotomaculum propionicicum TaxID=258475 RepID=A0A4Y7RP32_9FIRM|nr:metallophosphoesterase [Pelotomaculum propionicicum]NLI13481.1 metallophosphoesterase [Peptococcaceae bacterium]TEB10613.1 putative metallophosphoesterase [Pelotomaculum propionicicum]
MTRPFRVIVFSDSHGRLEYAFKALQETGRVDLVLHAGDLYRDAVALAEATGLPVKAVLGNCDKIDVGPEEQLIDLAGRRILLTHGHIGWGKHWPDKILERAREAGAEAIVFGHTHMAENVKEDGVLFFNPGSIGKPRDQARPSYGVLEISEDGIEAAIHRV